MGKLTVKGASKEQVLKIVRQYVNYPTSTFEGIAQVWDTSAKTISNILFRSIAEDIVSNRTADAIYNKVVYSHEKGVFQRKERWEKAFDQREELRNEMSREKKKLDAKITELKAKIASYDDYAFDEEGAPTKDDLIAELEELMAS